MSRMFTPRGFRRGFRIVAVGLVFVGQLDENVFQAGGERANFAHRCAVSGKLLAKSVEVEVIVNQRMNRLAEDGGAADSLDSTGTGQGASDFRGRDLHSNRSGRLNIGQFAQGVRSAVSDQLTVVNVGDVAAAFGFVHVVRGYEKGDAVAGQLEEQIPELTARDGIDTCRRFVQKKQLRFV